MLAVCFADNVALLAPSSSALLAICMLSTWVSFADSHHLIFNIDKTQLFRFTKLHTAYVPLAPQLIFLGHPLSVTNTYI